MVGEHGMRTIDHSSIVIVWKTTTEAAACGSQQPLDADAVGFRFGIGLDANATSSWLCVAS